MLRPFVNSADQNGLRPKYLKISMHLMGLIFYFPLMTIGATDASSNTLAPATQLSSQRLDKSILYPLTTRPGLSCELQGASPISKDLYTHFVVDLLPEPAPSIGWTGTVGLDIYATQNRAEVKSQEGSITSIITDPFGQPEYFAVAAQSNRNGPIALETLAKNFRARNARKSSSGESQEGDIANEAGNGMLDVEKVMNSRFESEAKGNDSNATNKYSPVTWKEGSIRVGLSLNQSISPTFRMASQFAMLGPDSGEPYFPKFQIRTVGKNFNELEMVKERGSNPGTHAIAHIAQCEPTKVRSSFVSLIRDDWIQTPYYRDFLCELVRKERFANVPSLKTGDEFEKSCKSGQFKMDLRIVDPAYGEESDLEGQARFQMRSLNSDQSPVIGYVVAKDFVAICLEKITDTEFRPGQRILPDDRIDLATRIDSADYRLTCHFLPRSKPNALAQTSYYTRFYTELAHKNALKQDLRERARAERLLLFPQGESPNKKLDPALRSLAKIMNNALTTNHYSGVDDPQNVAFGLLALAASGEPALKSIEAMHSFYNSGGDQFLLNTPGVSEAKLFEPPGTSPGKCGQTSLDSLKGKWVDPVFWQGFLFPNYFNQAICNTYFTKDNSGANAPIAYQSEPEFLYPFSFVYQAGPLASPMICWGNISEKPEYDGVDYGFYDHTFCLRLWSFEYRGNSSTTREIRPVTELGKWLTMDH